MPMVGFPSIDIVIPVHDRRELTRSCLLALRLQTLPPSRVVVVDDGSTDGTREMLAAEFPEVVVVRGSGDLWWTGATNAGCAWVLARRTDDRGAVVTLNDDTTPPPDWLANLASAAAERPGALVGSLVVDATTGRAVRAGHYVDWWTARYSAPLHGLSVAEVRARAGAFLTTDFLSGTGTWIPLRALRALGPFDPALPQYGADYEYSRRAARAGWELAVSTAAELPLHPSSTGQHADRSRDLASLAHSFWTRRSSTAAPYRLRLALRVCPRAALPSYLVCDAARVTGGALREFLAAHA